MPEYRVEATRAVSRALRKMDPPARKAILAVLVGLETDPRPPGCCALKNHAPWLRVRTTDYRVIYRVDDDSRTVEVAVVGHRREVYDMLRRYTLDRR